MKGHPMKKDTRVSAKPRMQPDGALLIEIWTDGYPTWKDFLDASGPQGLVRAVLEGIRLGHIKDIAVIQFCEGPIGGKDVDYLLMRRDGTVIPPVLPEGYEINAEGLTLSYCGPLVRH